MRRLLMGNVILFWGLLALLGCSSGDDEMDAVALIGRYQGTVQDSSAGTGALTLTVGAQGSDLTGTWATSFANARNNNSGQLSGNASGASVNLVLTPSVPTACPFQATGVVSGAQISGNYAAFNCTAVVTGTFSVLRQ